MSNKCFLREPKNVKCNKWFGHKITKIAKITFQCKICENLNFDNCVNVLYSCNFVILQKIQVFHDFSCIFCIKLSFMQFFPTFLIFFMIYGYITYAKFIQIIQFGIFECMQSYAIFCESRNHISCDQSHSKKFAKMIKLRNVIIPAKAYYQLWFWPLLSLKLMSFLMLPK